MTKKLSILNAYIDFSISKVSNFRVGLEIHENPFVNGKNDNVFKANMVVTNEPGIYVPGVFGIRIEDTCLITKTGCINLTKSDKNYIIVDK